jgi:hypothetical protein
MGQLSSVDSSLLRCSVLWPVTGEGGESARGRRFRLCEIEAQFVELSGFVQPLADCGGGEVHLTARF